MAYNTGSSGELRTSEQWSKLFKDYFIIESEDAHGWNKKNFHYSWMVERITLDVFLYRMKRSTCYFKKNLDELNSCIEYVTSLYS